MADLTLYYFPGACSFAPHVVLEEAGADYEAVLVDFASAKQRSPDYLAVNAKGRVPALRTAHGVLTENPAILGYLAETYRSPALAPLDDSFAFADMQAFNMFLSSSVHVTFAHAFRAERFVDGEAHQDAVKAKAAPALAAYFALIEARLADGRPFVLGNAFSVADAYLLVFARWLRRGAFVEAATIPHVIAHRERMEARPHVQRVIAREEATQATAA